MDRRNPSPPPEFEDNQEFRTDKIGDSAISKQWVLATLMEIINESTKHSKFDEDGELDISDDLQDSSCKLWDLCMDNDVVQYLLDYNIVDLILTVIIQSKAPRLTEIGVGILGNIACDEAGVKAISLNASLRETTLTLLSCRDTETLIEDVRLLRICINSSHCKSWYDTLYDVSQQFIQDISFILYNSTNEKLLHSVSEFVDKLVDEDEKTLSLCCNKHFLNAVVEGTLQLYKDDVNNSLTSLCHFLHLIHTLISNDNTDDLQESKELSSCIPLSFLSTLCTTWMTTHNKLHRNNDQYTMTSEEVSTSCLLSIAAPVVSNYCQEDGKEEVDAVQKFADKLVTCRGHLTHVSSDTTTKKQQLTGFVTPLHLADVATPVHSPAGTPHNDDKQSGFDSPHIGSSPTNDPHSSHKVTASPHKLADRTNVYNRIYNLSQTLADACNKGLEMKPAGIISKEGLV